MIEHDRQQVSAEDAAAVKPVAVEAAAVEAAARVLGVPLAPTMAERIAEGAQAAVTAVAAASRQWDSVGPTAPIGEPADYLGLLESLAPSANALPVVGVTPDPVAQNSDEELDIKENDPAAPWLDLDLVAAQALLGARGGGCEALVEAALQRAAAMQAQTRAWLAMDAESARERARWLEALLQQGPRSHRLPLPLLGIPLAHKDMFNLPDGSPEAAVRSPSCGSKLHSRLQSGGIATVIQRLEQAGAVTIGTLNMAEFALGATGHNAARGDCANAHDSDYIAGGSSSGSGVAVARAAVFASLGSDTGGSVRIPASVNGIFGLKPTYGLIPRTGSMKLAPSVDVIGPLARSARDIARLLRVVAGADGHDPLCSQRAVPDYEAAVQEGVAGLQVGIPDRYFFEGVEPQVRRALDHLRTGLEAAGVRFKVIEIPDVSALAELSRAVVYAEATGLHAPMLRASADDYSAQVRLRASTGLGIAAPVYWAALRLRLPILEQFVRQVFGQCEALFTPTIPIRVPRRDATDVGAGQALWPILSQLVRCTAPFNYLGVPAITVPAGWDESGLPVGAQFVARPFAEPVLLRLAAASQACGGMKRPRK
jgi:aspartyl-tRNA(Asn)/glutamyl-tRNA(Gln) amidotransferase subunit A